MEEPGAGPGEELAGQAITGNSDGCGGPSAADYVMGAMERRIELRRTKGRPPVPPAAQDDAAERTERVLSKLPEREWRVVSGLGGKVEHVVIGPGGIFAIQSRKPAGVGAARVKDGMLWLRCGGDARTDRSGGAINREALEAARALHKAIRARTGRGGPLVQPVVVLWCDFPQAVAESDRIAFVRGRDLLDWIARRPQRLDAPGREEVVEAVSAIPSERGAASRWKTLGGLRHSA